MSHPCLGVLRLWLANQTIQVDIRPQADLLHTRGKPERRAGQSDGEGSAASSEWKGISLLEDRQGHPKALGPRSLFSPLSPFPTAIPIPVFLQCLVNSTYGLIEK